MSQWRRCTCASRANRSGACVHAARRAYSRHAYSRCPSERPRNLESLINVENAGNLEPSQFSRRRDRRADDGGRGRGKAGSFESEVCRRRVAARRDTYKAKPCFCSSPGSMNEKTKLERARSVGRRPTGERAAPFPATRLLDRRSRGNSARRFPRALPFSMTPGLPREP